MNLFHLSVLHVCMGGCVFSYVTTICTVTTSSLFSLKVIFVRDGNMGRLIIDGLTVLEDRAQGSNVSWHVSSPFYVGGVPPGRAQKNIQVWGTVYSEIQKSQMVSKVSDFWTCTAEII